MKRGSVGPEGKFNAGRFVEGRFGQGIELNMQEQFGVTFPVGIVPTSAGCIEFWAKLADLPEAMPWGQKPGLIGVNDRDEGNRGSILHFNGNDGASNGGLRAGLGGIGSAGTARRRPKTSGCTRRSASRDRLCPIRRWRFRGGMRLRARISPRRWRSRPWARSAAIPSTCKCWEQKGRGRSVGYVPAHGVGKPTGKRVFATSAPPVEAEGLTFSAADLNVALTQRLPPILSDSAGTRQIQDLLGGVANTAFASDQHFESARRAAQAGGDASLDVILRWLHVASRRMVASAKAGLDRAKTQGMR